jgi:uncharacterized protein (DUF58 family)
MPHIPYRYLDGETLAKLASLQLRVKSVVEGTLAGLHRSPHHGASIEFAEHKEYSPGDDLRHLDWKAFGKFDRYYVKRFEDETELHAYLLLDCSGSMSYGSPLTKLEYASVLVASLAYLLTRQGDETALLTYAQEISRYLPPRARTAHFFEVLSALEATRPAGRTDLARAIRYLNEVMRGRSLAILVSDLFDTSEDGLNLLRHLRARRHHVVLFHLLHPDELVFPFGEVTLFESLEDDARILVDPAGVRASYLEHLGAWLEELRRSCEEVEIDYQRVSTAEPLEEVLLRFLRSERRERP